MARHLARLVFPGLYTHKRLYDFILYSPIKRTQK
nr:MAG TPA: hypothetical protein [Caudoviricetes sp.]DAO40191.1 MAG TPA: hypothetical protein [Caudoviricetes sp.]DAS37818.1 MAG TPA: hypothetical protein [Caudoviricetes sp.]